ncbi:MAG: hypothetical protein Q8N23_23385 [Archangium sp.]|nr:hypothetical protein [Archangium sp.]MDP3155635.1 hypothetical protein [Archangium sp.]MDP3570759.1 hypothetical protein [Archangium sp.]
MSEINDPELEALLAELAPTEAERVVLLEEHRQLEKDLLRLADPLPPPDFLASVMSRVAEAPARPLSRADVWSAVAIVGVTMSLAVIALLVSGGVTGGFGLALASIVVKLREGLIASGSALLALWTTAALPTVVGLSLLLAATLTAFRRLVQPAHVKAVS